MRNCGGCIRGRSSVRPVPGVYVFVSRLTSLVVTTPGRIRSSVYHLTRVTHTTNVRLIVTAREPSISIVANLVGTGVSSHVTLAISSRVSSEAVLSSDNTRGLLNGNSVLCGPVNTDGPVHIRNYFVDSRRVRRLYSFVGGRNRSRCSRGVRGRVRTGTIRRGGDPFRNSRRSDGFSPLFRGTTRVIVRANATSASFLREGLSINCTEKTGVVSRLRRCNIVNPPRKDGPHRILVGGRV